MYSRALSLAVDKIFASLMLNLCFAPHSVSTHMLSGMLIWDRVHTGVMKLAKANCPMQCLIYDLAGLNSI